MSLISFKNIKLFKIPAIPPRKSPKPALHPKETKPPFAQRVLQEPFLYLLLFALALAYLISYIPSKSLPLLKEGEIASSDIVAPDDLTIEDIETTKKRRAEAAKAVLPIYFFDQNVFLNTEDKIRQFFSDGREWIKKTPPSSRNSEQLQKDIFEKFGIELPLQSLAYLERISYSAEIEESLINLLAKIMSSGVILSKNLFIRQEQERGFTLVGIQEDDRTVQVQEILDIKEAKEKLANEINKLDLTSRRKSLLISLSHSLVTPNIAFNKVETEARKEGARSRVETVFYNIKKGKVLIRKGDEATPEAIRLIQLINSSLRTKPSWLTNFIGTFLLFGLLFVTLWYYLKSLLTLKTAFKYFLMMGITLILSLLTYKLLNFFATISSQHTNLFLFRDTECCRYAFPYSFGVILFAFLTSNPIALIYAIFNSLLVGYLFAANFYLMIFSLIGSLAAIYGIKYFQKQKRTSTLKAGLFLVSPINIFVIITFYLIKQRWVSPGFLASEIFMGLLGGALCAALSFLLLPLYENIFGFLTQTKLMDLINSDLPVLKQLAMEAPGSYHHSLFVATLAEKAAEGLKLNPLLVKAGALFHDIGKIKRPEYFIENKDQKIDAHKTLKPSMSTLVIINHVKEGAEMAKKLKLPREIKEMIEQHHGNSLVRYFFQKAKEKYDPEMQTIGEENYRYPGPLPQSKETALIMLADSVDAASRSLKNHSEDNLKRMIKDIFDNYLQDGQLDDCNFSLRELRFIASSFLSTLLTIYKPRVKYPGFDFEMDHKKKMDKAKKANDRSLKQTEEKQD
ncbi:MAG: HDIG domain-containing metalloprotein [Candidatus Aminicenantales bacterium]